MTRRIDPRRPAVITPAGLRRIVLGSDAGERSARAAVASATPKPLRSRGPFNGCLLVIAHSDGGTLDDAAREALAAAALLAAADEAVHLIVIGACKDDLAAAGADRVQVVARDDRYRPLAWTAALAARCQALQPRHLLMPDRGPDADIGRRVGVQLGWTAAAPVVELANGEARVRAAGGHDALIAQPRVLLLARHVARTELPFVGAGVADREPLAIDDGVYDGVYDGVEDLGVTPGHAATLALEEADFIVSAGNGVRDVPLFNDLAHALNAATGASRVAVDDGRFARHQQVGATGKTVQARGYLAIGISGAVQHLQGIKACRHVMAINTDPAAPMVARAEFSAIADAQPLMRALLAQVREARS